MASSSSDKTVRIWIPNANGDSMVLKGHSGPVRCVQFGNSKNGICNYWGDHSRMYQESETSSTLLITASDDKTAKIWSLPSKRFICSFSGHTNFVRAAKFSPDTCLVSIRFTKNTHLYSIAFIASCLVLLLNFDLGCVT